LFLGPSGVGKTETCKVLAKTVYGSERSFTRIDMSEFSEQHTVQRLIGAPPGYIGFETGGQLTNAISEQPYSLILLDEIEKAHPKIFDIFLQVFDDGRLTDGQGKTVNFTNSIVIATSNLGIEEIVQAFKKGVDVSSASFMEKTLMPILMKNFRTEFLNRFDAIVVFNPLSIDKLVEIAELEIKKIEERVKEHNIRFNIDPEILKEKIQSINDLRFGARPVKRFVEQTCESLIAMKLLE
ncbi:MAG: ATP-dependent Clp protease ATP-binding subunit ClpB, partial [Candidatus Doudnabacteria bacterium Gr01-1014_77]